MIVTLIVVCEIAFWLLLAVGLSLRYLARRPRLGALVLLCEPLLELVLLVATAIDLRNGAAGDFKHGLAAVYIGFTVGYGHYVIRWADGHFAHRFAGGPRPVRPPRYGRARAVHEWRMWGRTVLSAAVAVVLLQLAVWYVGDPARSEALVAWQQRMGMLVGVWTVVALSYTIWPKRPKDGGSTGLATEVDKEVEQRGVHPGR